MKKFLTVVLLFFAWPLLANQSPHLNEVLPNFALQDSKGSLHRLSDYRGGYVMLFTLGYG